MTREVAIRIVTIVAVASAGVWFATMVVIAYKVLHQ